MRLELLVSKDEVAVREFNLFYESLNLVQKEWVDDYRGILKEELREGLSAELI